MNPDLAAWWRDVRPRLVPLHEGPTLDAEALASSLRALLGDRLSPDDPAARVALPEAFAAMLAQVGGTSWLGQRIALDFILASADGVRARFAYALSLYDDDESVGPRGAGVWVEFAQRGDHTAWFLCCDPQRAEFGMVGRGDDDHPWLNGVGGLGPLVTFAQWLARIRETPLRARSPVLLALDADDLARVRAASPDAVCAVRAVVDRRTPDSAWAHTLDAPERALMVPTPDAVHAAVRAAAATAVVARSDLEAWLLDAPARLGVPATPAWSVLAWEPRRASLRAVDDATGCLRDFVARASAEGRALLWVVERGG
ncbi:MAG: hypothetical protein U0325_06300 [Polyangiales bacterium]